MVTVKELVLNGWVYMYVVSPMNNVVNDQHTNQHWAHAGHMLRLIL